MTKKTAYYSYMKKSMRAINAYMNNREKPVQDSGFIKITALPKHTKIAKFLLLLDEQESSEILKKLPSEDVPVILSEIERIDKVDILEAEGLLKEFDFLKHKPDRARGGVETAEKLLTKAFGEEKAHKILKKSGSTLPKEPFSFLSNATAKQIYPLIKEESPQVLSLILLHLPREKSASVLKMLTQEQQKRVIRRMIKSQRVSRSLIMEVEQKIHGKMPEDRELEEYVDGTTILANIMKYMNIEGEKSLLSALESEDSKMAGKVRDQLFTMDVVLHMRDRDLKSVLDEFSDKDIAVILKAKSDDIKNKLLENLSERRKVFVEEELTLMGRIPLSEVNIVTKEFLDYLKEKKELGELDIPLEEDEFLL